MNLDTKIHLNKFSLRPYQIPIFDALENKGYRRVLMIWPRRSGKDLVAFNYCIRYLLKRICVIYYIFPTYSQGKKVIWDSITNSGQRIMEYIPKEVIASSNSQEMKIRFTHGSLLQIVGSDNVDCFDGKTEILTQNGWKLFNDLLEEDFVATNRQGELLFEKPLRILKYDYSGDMYEIKSNSIDMLVTPNHRFFVRSCKGVYKFKAISDPTIRHDSIPSQSEWHGVDQSVFKFPTVEYSPSYHHPITNKELPMEDFVALLGIFLSEGSTYQDNKNYRITISQVKPRIRTMIRDLLSRCGVNFLEFDDGFSFNSKQMCAYFSAFGKQHERYIPNDIKRLSKKYLQILFDWLIYGDGYQGKDSVYYYSSSKRLIDDVQEIIIKLGLSGNVVEKKQTDNGSIKGRLIASSRTLYSIRVRTSKFKRLTSGAKEYISKKSYTGKVYCVSVSSGIIKVRRNGKECWSGNSLVGTNPNGVVFSEYALQDPRAYQFIRPILAANDGWALFISTPRGRNHLWELYNIATNSDDWYCSKLSLDDTNHIPMQEIERERAEGTMSEELIQQEYYCSFERGVEGSYYAKYIDRMRMKGQIGQVPWEPGFKVHTAWDLGVRDSTSIIFFQVVGQTVRIIDYYDKNKEGLEHYIGVLNSKPYQYGKHIAPHDIKVREFGSGMTRIDKAGHLGVTFTIAPNLSIMDGIEAVRTTLPKCWIDETNCVQLIKSLEGYRQEYDAKRRVYKENPLHDSNSHAADAARYMALSLPKTRDGMSADDVERQYQQAVYGDSAGMPAMFRDDNNKWY